MQFLEATYRTTEHIALPYVLYTPVAGPEPEADGPYPLIMYLHGSGERGTDTALLRNHGLLKVCENMELPFFILAPQCPVNNWWASYHNVLIDLLDHIQASHPIDKTRTYLTGNSMGGFGTWHLASEYPNRFAAIAPICGFGHRLFGFPERLRRLRHTPVWAFHGDADDVVPIAETQTLVSALHQYGGQVNFTSYPGVDHDSWTMTYENETLYEWFLVYKLADQG